MDWASIWAPSLTIVLPPLVLLTAFSKFTQSNLNCSPPPIFLCFRRHYQQLIARINIPVVSTMYCIFKISYLPCKSIEFAFSRSVGNDVTSRFERFYGTYKKCKPPSATHRTNPRPLPVYPIIVVSCQMRLMFTFVVWAHTTEMSYCNQIQF
jgi:hypothetical protein